MKKEHLKEIPQRKVKKMPTIEDLKNEELQNYFRNSDKTQFTINKKLPVAHENVLFGYFEAKNYEAAFEMISNLFLFYSPSMKLMEYFYNLLVGEGGELVRNKTLQLMWSLLSTSDPNVFCGLWNSMGFWKRFRELVESNSCDIILFMVTILEKDFENCNLENLNNSLMYKILDKDWKDTLRNILPTIFCLFNKEDFDFIISAHKILRMLILLSYKEHLNFFNFAELMKFHFDDLKDEIMARTLCLQFLPFTNVFRLHFIDLIVLENLSSFIVMENSYYSKNFLKTTPNELTTFYFKMKPKLKGKLSQSQKSSLFMLPNLMCISYRAAVELTKIEGICAKEFCESWSPIFTQNIGAKYTFPLTELNLLPRIVLQ